MYIKAVTAFHVVLYGMVAAPLSLEDAVKLALSHNRQVLAAGLRAEESKTQIGVTESRRYPAMRTQGQMGISLTRADVTFPRGALGEYAGTGPIPGNDMKVGIPRQLTGFSYSQVGLPLTQQLRTGAAITGARLQFEEAGLGRRLTEAEITRQVRQAYFSLLALDAGIAAAKANVAVAVEVERLAGQGVENGTALKVELREATARVERVRAALENTQLERDNLRDAFQQLLGQPLDSPLELAGLPVLESDVDAAAAQGQARMNRAEVRTAQVRIKQAEAAAKGKKYEFIPDISLAVTHFGFLNTSNLAPANFATAGLSFDWEPWDWGRKKNELKGLRFQAQRARLELEEQQQSVAREAARAVREWRQSDSNLRAAESLVAAQTERVNVVKQRYQEQSALLRQLLEAQADYEAAQEQRVRALAGRGTAWANLQFALGAE